MNVGELLEALEGVNPELRIRLAYQPNWPLRSSLRAVVTPEMWDECDDGFDEDGEPIDEEELEERRKNPESNPNAEFLWLVEGDGPSYDESPYAPKRLWDFR